MKNETNEAEGKLRGYIAMVLCKEIVVDFGIHKSRPVPFGTLAPGCIGVMLVFDSHKNAEEYTKQNTGDVNGIVAVESNPVKKNENKSKAKGKA